MNGRAWTYIWFIYGLGVVLAVQAALVFHGQHPNWLLIEVLFGGAVVAQLFKAEAPNHVLFYTTPIFFFAGTLFLDPFLLFLLIAVPHLAEWARERWAGSSNLKAWYLQPFNIAMYWIA